MENTPSKKHKKRTRNEPEEYSKSSPGFEGSLRKNYDVFGARGGDRKRARKTKLQGSEVTVTGDTDGHKTDKSGKRRKTKCKKDLENDGFENGNKSCSDESGGTTDGIPNKKKKNRKREAEDEKAEDLDGISKEEKKDESKKKRQKRAAKENKESCENVCSLDGVANEKAKKKRRESELSKNGSNGRDSDASTPDEKSDLTKKRNKGKEDAENDNNENNDSHGCSPESKRKKKKKRHSGEENTKSDKKEKRRAMKREEEVKRNANIVKEKGYMDEERRLLLTENEQENTEKKKEKKKKKDKKQSSNEMEETAKTDEEGQKEPEVHPALIYLDCWKNDRANWHFKKVRQVWLLQNMFNVDKVPKDKFRVLVKYLEGIKGGARGETIRKAEELLQKDEDNAVLQNRVKQVVQILTEQE